MGSTPYTDAALAQLSIDEEWVSRTFLAEPIGTPLSEVTCRIGDAIRNMRSAERTANMLMTKLADETRQQTDRLLAGNTRFTAERLTTFAQQAAAADSTLSTGIKEVAAWKRVLDTLTAQATNA